MNVFEGVCKASDLAEAAAAAALELHREAVGLQPRQPGPGVRGLDKYRIVTTPTLVRAFSVIVKTSQALHLRILSHIDHERPRHGGVPAVPGHGLVQHQRPDGGSITRPESRVALTIQLGQPSVNPPRLLLEVGGLQPCRQLCL